MFTLSPITDRVKKIREKYRSTRPKICIARYKIVTDFYKENPQLQGILKRAKCFKELAEKEEVKFNEEQWKASELLIETQIKALIARNLWDLNAFYEIMAVIDDEYRQAIELLKDDNAFKKLNVG